MIGRILKIGLILIAGYLGFTYFFGNAEEKAQSREIVGDIGQAGKKIFGKIGVMLNKQKDNFDEGKHDEALSKVGAELDKLKQRAKDDKLIERAIERLELEKENISDNIKNATPEEKQNLKARFKKLVDRTQEVLQKMESKSE